MFKYYKWSLLFTALCLALGTWLGWTITHDVAATLGIVWIVLVLGVLEISLSFDNAVVNATVLRDMDPVWRRRFLTWGIVIAVFGMRILFPLAIVAIAAKLGPIDAVKLAATDPVTYERIITGAHVGISGFGGAFLAMVGLTFFLDEDKDSHWIGPIERPFASLSRVSGLALGVVLLALYGISRMIAPEDAMTFIVSGIFGLLAYIGVQAIGALLEREEEEDVVGSGNGAAVAVVKSGLASFLYLEVLDASFSFDGVIGAFALSNNLFIIALGLGIGAMFVRSMTVMLVDRGTLTEYRYLEHGAFYAILALATIMLLSVRFEIPETVTGLIGAGFIGIAFAASLRSNRAEATAAVPLEDADPVGPTGEHLNRH
ncbi:DUF475 domain-containing protein [Sphingomonas sp. HT-1]|uniref:DUF475 domain-containing protein n=1 Tax=unclassified Sphingomonas TaxID=196159 RepID=UPI0002F0E913|nr:MULTISPECIES: DUF475 domain-containing protein [unclassified Sphingomonas]KTF68998.1 hypothetical protein ATB93_11070 [Sphingomonas sp. WG]